MPLRISPSQRPAVQKRLDRGLAVIPPPLMRTLLVVRRQPDIEIDLQFLQHPIDLLPERHPIELGQPGFVEALANPVGLGTLRLGPRMIDILHGQIEFVLMPIRCPAVFRSPICQGAIERNLMLLEPGEDPIIQQLRRWHRCLLYRS